MLTTSPISGKEARVWLFCHIVLSACVVAGFALTWGRQDLVPWYRHHLNESDYPERMLTLGISRVYLDGKDVGSLNTNCTWGDGTLVLLDEERCSAFLVVQKMALGTVISACGGLIISSIYVLGLVIQRRLIVSVPLVPLFPLVGTVIFGLLALNPSFFEEINPTLFIVTWILSICLMFRVVQSQRAVSR